MSARPCGASREPVSRHCQRRADREFGTPQLAKIGAVLVKQLLARLVRRARRDGYTKMEGSVTAGNGPMLALARKLKFLVHMVPDDATVVQVQRRL